MGSLLKHLQYFIDHPMAMLIPYINSVNALFHQIIPLLTFEPRLAVGLKQKLMSDILWSLQDSTSA